MKKLALSIFVILSFSGISAQEVDSIKPVKNVFQGTRFIHLHSANVVGKNQLQLLIQHRFGDISGGFYEFFGLDQSSNRFGFEYGILKNLTVGIGRSSYYKTYDSFLKYRILTQTASFPLTVTATVAGSFPTIKDLIPEEYSDFSEKASGNVQLHVSKSFKNFGFQVSPGYIGTGYIPDENNIYSSHSFFTLGFGGSARLAKKVTFNIEYLYRFEDEIENTNPLSASIDFGTSGHLFQIMISNVQQMYDQGIIANLNSSEGGDWSEGHLFLGFNLIRAFNFNKY